MKDNAEIVLMVTWDYPNSQPTQRMVTLGLASALGNNGCAYKIQAIDLEFGTILYEWKHS